MSDAVLDKTQLGKATKYTETYDADLLFPIPREGKRDELGISRPLPFHGYDIWNGYELSWLDAKGKPHVAVVEFKFPCASTHIVESKSFKLYLNSFIQTQFKTEYEVVSTLTRDLSTAAGANVSVRLIPLSEIGQQAFKQPPGICLDDLDIDITNYHLSTGTLHAEGEVVEEMLYSDLLKSNCPVTGQPDWATLMIHYHGPRIDRAGLLRYIISYRQHTEFHEQCVERIFMDLQSICRAEKLAVYARYTRRGGLDINPFRANFTTKLENYRLARQ